MSIKDDSQYKYYIFWLEDRLNKGSINKGQFELYKLSESFFSDFCLFFESSYKFKQSIEQLYKSTNRDEQIDDIFRGI